jgi:hypothetical protein
MSLPSAFMIATLAESGVSSSKAMRLPSGDQSGRTASPSTWVIWRRSWPLGRTVKICAPASVSE